MTAWSSPDLPFEITQPTLLVDKQRAVQNIQGMARKADEAGVRFRPHFKTHQSADVGNWFRYHGVEAITVSSVTMAQYFAQHGWTNVTIAFPVNLLEMYEINKLAGTLDLSVVVDSGVAVERLMEDLVAPVRTWIKVDTGYRRVGVSWDQPEKIVALARAIHRSRPLRFEGLLTHSGQSYQAKSREDIQRIHEQAVFKLTSIKERLEFEGIQECEISIGDTPTCRLAEDFSGVDEIRPGNFVFCDVAQYTLGVCDGDEIAVALACPVVGKYKDRKQIAVYGGAVHLSKESVRDSEDRRIFGYLARGDQGTIGPMLEDASVVSLTQEHGIIQMEDPLLDEVQIGDIVLILPVHSCLTCNLHREYRTLDGDILTRL
jgi:D-serine deaminase-like pyridoxal phosphate-dependent protein